jgi:hypothetical protein
VTRARQKPSRLSDGTGDQAWIDDDEDGAYLTIGDAAQCRAFRLTPDLAREIASRLERWAAAQPVTS